LALADIQVEPESVNFSDTLPRLTVATVPLFVSWSVPLQLS
jgi:hypothetical protein